jgi:hypothetical protein
MKSIRLYDKYGNRERDVLSTLHFISLFADLVHHGTPIVLLKLSVLLFAAAALCLAWSCCQSDCTSCVSWTEIVASLFDCARLFHFFFFFGEETFSFQRHHMHQNIIAKVFWSCTFSPCIINSQLHVRKAVSKILVSLLYFDSTIYINIKHNLSSPK